MRIGIVAGEASGDELGAAVLAALTARLGPVRAEGIGGPLLRAQGLDSRFPMERLAVMGLTEPLRRLPELLRIRRALLAQFRADPPDLFLGIDAPDFNLGLERALRRGGIPVAHLVSPSVWAWRAGRLRHIRRAVDRMLCLFPFEPALYTRAGIPAEFVGHPLAEAITGPPDPAAARAALGLPARGRVLALLPGSRGGEVRRLAPVFLETARQLRAADPALSLVLPAAGVEREAELAALLRAAPDLEVTLLRGRAREAMAAADAVLLASGTATLEAALLGRPMVVAYRLSRPNWWLLSRLVSTPFVALPNILAGRRLVPELLQDAATPAALAAQVAPLLAGGEAARAQVRDLAALGQTLRGDFASRSAAALIHLAGARP